MTEYVNLAKGKYERQVRREHISLACGCRYWYLPMVPSYIYPSSVWCPRPYQFTPREGGAPNILQFYEVESGSMNAGVLGLAVKYGM